MNKKALWSSTLVVIMYLVIFTFCLLIDRKLEFIEVFVMSMQVSGLMILAILLALWTDWCFSD